MVELKSIEITTDRILKIFDRIMKQNDIDYILFAGTCLGFYRDGGYISHDNDIDIIIKYESKEQVEKIIDIMTENGFSLSMKHPQQNKLVKDCYGEVYSNLNFHNIGYILIDIFLAYEINSYYYVDTKWRFEKQLLDEYGFVEYKNMKFKTPKDIERYLGEIYLDWKTPTIREKCKDKQEFAGHKIYEQI